MTKPATSIPLLAFNTLFAITMARSADAGVWSCHAEDIGCLRNAIIVANSNGESTNTIRLAAGIYTLSDVDNDTNGPNGLPSITSALSIDGVGRDSVVITRAADAPDFRLFHVASTGNLTLRDVFINNGRSTGAFGTGGGLYNAGVVTIIRGGLVGNYAEIRGGAVESAGSVFNPLLLPTVTLTNTVVAGNSSSEAGLTGGIFVFRSALAVANTTFSGNAGSSGAIGILRSFVEITKSRFEQNVSTAGSPSIGGAVNVSLGGRVDITKSHFVANVGSSVSAIGTDLNAGAINLTETTFQGNTGGHFVIYNSYALMTVTNSAFVENAGSTNSAIHNGASGLVEVTNTTFALNQGTVITNNGNQLVLRSSSVVGSPNAGDALEPLIQGSTGFGPPPTILQNSIVSHDPADSSLQDCAGPIESLGNNLISDPYGCSITLQPGDLTGDAGLGALVNNGRAGRAHVRLRRTSQAIGAANDDTCPETDQIGRLRHPSCDIGAVEFPR